MSRYPYTYKKETRYKGDCPTCGKHTTLIQRKMTTEVSWFRGEDEVEITTHCPVCEDWKTICKICGKLCQCPKGLEMHTFAKHGKEAK